MAHSTRNDLADALRQLLSDRSLDKITVQNIADAANVSRKTFYYHFQDVYDLLEWMLEQCLLLLHYHCLILFFYLLTLVGTQRI